ncbi:TPR-like protein [Ceratobasidium sp. AG-Ba]|nr:TPR-like protein [Ceratobasidium sp. AG-Ba]QRW06150.1 TPR-like protein [Ceratobasidium sp. AG-Ba]
MNTTLETGLSTSGYLTSQSKTNGSIPKPAEGEVSEALWYACRFWPDHVGDDDRLSGVQDVLADFLERNLVRWLELVPSYGEYRDITHIWRRVEAVEIYRARAEGDPEQYERSLALSLEEKSWSSKQLGDLENALDTIQQAVNIRRRFASHGSLADLACLAKSLSSLGSRYGDVGRHVEALAAAQEGVELYEKLAEVERNVYVVELEKLLHTLSISHNELGQLKQSLEMIQRAVEMGRQLANEKSEMNVSELA